MLKIVNQILNKKGRDVLTITQDASLYEALKMMAEHNIGALIVTEEGKPAGIFSERDYARAVESCKEPCQLIKVREIMSSDIFIIHPDTTIDEAMSIVTESRCRHLPVMVGDELVGMVSIGDLVKATIDEKNFVIKQMEKYIKGEH